MTVMEMFKTKTPEEIAEAYVNIRKKGCGEENPWFVLLNPFVFAFRCEGCYFECNQLHITEDGEYYCVANDSGLNLGCPRHLDFDEMNKQMFLDWLNAKIEM